MTDVQFAAHFGAKIMAESQATTEDARFYNNALKSSHIEGKMSAREMTFARNVPPVAKDANVA